MTIATTREQIYQALFDRLSVATFATAINGQTTWAGSVRRFVDPAQLPAQPFLCQYEGMMEAYHQGGNRLPPIRELGVRLFCWAQAGSGDFEEISSRYITTMIEAIEQALEPEESGYGFPGLCTLGGLVQWARIDGTILKLPGDTETQCMVSIPVKVLWP